MVWIREKIAARKAENDKRDRINPTLWRIFMVITCGQIVVGVINILNSAEMEGGVKNGE